MKTTIVTNAVELASFQSATIPTAMVTGYGLKGIDKIQLSDMLHAYWRELPVMDFVDAIQTIIGIADALSDKFSTPMMLRALDVFLTKDISIDPAGTKRPGLLCRSAMRNMVDDPEFSVVTFELLDILWKEEKISNGRGGFCSIGEAFIGGDYPMEPIMPKILSVKDGIEIWIPVPWKTYAESFLQRDQAEQEEAEQALVNKQLISTMINNIRIKHHA